MCTQILEVLNYQHEIDNTYYWPMHRGSQGSSQSDFSGGFSTSNNEPLFQSKCIWCSISSILSAGQNNWYKYKKAELWLRLNIPISVCRALGLSVGKTTHTIQEQ